MCFPLCYHEMCWWSVGVVPSSAEHGIGMADHTVLSHTFSLVVSAGAGDVPAPENTSVSYSWEQDPYITTHLRGVRWQPFGRYGKVCPAACINSINIPAI